VTAGGAVGAARGVAGGTGGIACGTVVVAAWGRNPGGIAGAGRGFPGGSKSGGISGGSRRGAGVEVAARSRQRRPDRGGVEEDLTRSVAVAI
jgi:hypothetical protein